MNPSVCPCRPLPRPPLINTSNMLSNIQKC
jgi:hypothetical protein